MWLSCSARTEADQEDSWAGWPSPGGKISTLAANRRHCEDGQPKVDHDAERPWLEAWSLPVQIQLMELVRVRSGDEVPGTSWGG